MGYPVNFTGVHDNLQQANFNKPVNPFQEKSIDCNIKKRTLDSNNQLNSFQQNNKYIEVVPNRNPILNQGTQAIPMKEANIRSVNQNGELVKPDLYTPIETQTRRQNKFF